MDPRVFLIPVEAQMKKLTSFSLDAERIKGPRRPELPSCSILGAGQWVFSVASKPLWKAGV
jgi:hypothetical protein